MANTRAVSAVRSEANGLDIPVEFEGETYRIPPSKLWPLEAIEAAEDGRAVASTKLILGTVQYDKFRETNSTLGDLERFMDKVQEVMGGNL